MQGSHWVRKHPPSEVHDPKFGPLTTPLRKNMTTRFCLRTSLEELNSYLSCPCLCRYGLLRCPKESRRSPLVTWNVHTHAHMETAITTQDICQAFYHFEQPVVLYLFWPTKAFMRFTGWSPQISLFRQLTQWCAHFEAIELHSCSTCINLSPFFLFLTEQAFFKRSPSTVKEQLANQGMAGTHVPDKQSPR